MANLINDENRIIKKLSINSRNHTKIDYFFPTFKKFNTSIKHLLFFGINLIGKEYEVFQEGLVNNNKLESLNIYNCDVNTKILSGILEHHLILFFQLLNIINH